MSNLWLNLRIGGVFIQISRFSAGRPLKANGKPGSRLWVSRVEGRPKDGEPWLELYELRWPW